MLAVAIDSSRSSLKRDLSCSEIDDVAGAYSYSSACWLVDWYIMSQFAGWDADYSSENGSSFGAFSYDFYDEGSGGPYAIYVMPNGQFGTVGVFNTEYDDSGGGKK